MYQEFHFVISNRILAFTSVIYMGIIFVSFATNTSFRSYSYGYGYNGWFYAANEIGALVSMLAPITVMYFSSILVKSSPKKASQLLIGYTALLLVCFCSTFIGTKVVLAAILGYIVCCLLWSLIRWNSTKRQKRIFSFFALHWHVYFNFIKLFYIAT